jgi:DNA-binding CsgD family transcriptional regulator
MDATITPERLERDIAALAGRGHDAYTLRVEAMARIERAVATDGWCFATADPETLVTTTHATCGVQRELGPALFRIEYGEPDVGKHRALARGPSSVSVMSQDTAGAIERSPRYREVLQPMGVGDELRAAVKARGATWGFVHLFRGEDRRAFGADDAELVERAARALGAILRDAVLAQPAIDTVAASDAPSFLLLGADGRPRDVTPNAQTWLEALRDPELPHGQVPDLLVALTVGAQHAPEGQVTRARVRGTDGRWYVLHASRTANEDVAVLAGLAPPNDLVPLLLSGLGLTPAERRVTELVLQGRSTKQIAADLVLSPYTVQDRLKAIFDKAGVRSRRDLVAQLTGASD